MAGKKITELSSGSLSNISLSGVTTVVYSGTTFQHSLSDLRNKLVDSGSHYFTGSQHIIGDLTVSGSITAHEYILSSSITNIEIQNISGSSNFGNDLEDTHIFTGSLIVTGSVDVSGSQRITDNIIIGLDIHHNSGDPEVLHAANSGSYNIAHFQGDNEYYTQINVVNLNSSSLSSTDIVATADNGNETVHFVNLGINSSTYNGGYVGYENDAYLLNVGKDLYIGTVGGTSHPAELKLFAHNSWENPQITIHTGSEVSFNTGSVTEGYMYEFSGSVKLNNGLTVNGDQSITGSVYLDSVNAVYFGGENGGWISNFAEGSIQIKDPYGYIQLDAQSSTNYTQLTLNSDGYEFFSVNDLNSDVALQLTKSGSLLLNGVSYDAHLVTTSSLSTLATTGSNTFNGNQTINGIITLDNSSVIKDTANQSISFGVDAANSGQGTQSTAIGSNAGQTDQGNGATALGALAGNLIQGQSAVAIGALAGSTQQGDWAIAIGTQAGGINQGNYSIALGNLAGGLNQAANSVIINATGTQLDNTVTSSLKIAPIRNVVGGDGILQYNNTTKEVSYNNTISGSNTFVGNQTISGSLDISGSATLNDGNIVSSNTIEKIETITSASYASITPVSGTLYIIIN